MAAVRPVGTAAEWTVVPAEQAVPLPDGVSLDLGASLGVPAMTAYHCVFADGPVDGTDRAGRPVVPERSATSRSSWPAGAVLGSISTVSGPEKAELATAAGAHLVVNYTDDDAVDQIKAFAPAVDRVVEVAIGANLGMDLELSRSGTTIVSYAAAGADPVLPVRACMSANVVLALRAAVRRAAPGTHGGNPRHHRCVDRGRPDELPVHRFSLDDIAPPTRRKRPVSPARCSSSSPDSRLAGEAVEWVGRRLVSRPRGSRADPVG